MHIRKYHTYGVMIALLNLTGCAQLRISVDCYKGELINSADSKLGEAVGIARNVYSAVKHLHGPRQTSAWNFKKYWSKEQQEEIVTHMNTIVASYDGVGGEPGIEQLWGQYSALSSDNASRIEARARLARALFQFGGAAAGLGRYRALPEAIRFHYPFPINWFVVDTETLVEGIGLEEAGRWILFLTDDAIDTSYRGSIARLMQSVTLGHSGSMLNAQPIHPLPSVRKGLEDTHWSKINDINVSGIGDCEYVIIKDEIGNWHIKSLLVDQSEIINAVFDGADAIVGVLAAYYGIDASKNPIDANKKPAVADDFVTERVAAAHAKALSERMQSAGQAFQIALVMALGESDAAKMQSKIKEAVNAFSNQIGALDSASGSGSGKGADPSKGQGDG